MTTAHVYDETGFYNITLLHDHEGLFYNVLQREKIARAELVEGATFRGAVQRVKRGVFSPIKIARSILLQRTPGHVVTL